MTDPLLEIRDLDIEYEADGGNIHAVSDASFTVNDNEYFGLVGESGCGKSTIANSIIGGLDSNGKVTNGKIIYKGEEIQDYSETQFNQNLRWKEISVIPQASMNSLDPLMKISEQAVNIAQVHTELTKDEVITRLENLFDTVGLPTSRIFDYPHQFSGGMQQRAIIALSLMLEPSLIIADEPTTALDVIMQDQIINYINDLKEEWGLTLLLITHDISVVFENCDSMAVMHAGQVAETGTVTEVYDSPRHPYALLLQQAFPDIQQPDKTLHTIEGNPPQLNEEVDYCTFADRCPWAIEDCKAAAPKLEAVNGDSGHRASCIRSGELPELAEADGYLR